MVKYGYDSVSIPYTKKYKSEKALIWVYFTQCCSGVSFADFGQIVAARDVILPFLADDYYYKF